MKIKTQSGSTYELDLLEKKFRRLTGEGSPTLRLGSDGEWKVYQGITFPRVGDRIWVTWGHTDHSTQVTTTSPVAEITDMSETDVAVCLTFGRESQNSC